MYRNINKGEMMTITVGYKQDPIKRSKLRMTVYFNVRRLFLENGFWKLEFQQERGLGKSYGNFSEEDLTYKTTGLCLCCIKLEIIFADANLGVLKK